MASRLHRLIRIIRFVGGGGFPSVHDLCRTLQVKERTFFGDLKELKEDLGVDIQFDRTRRGYYLASEDSVLTFSTMNEDTALLLLAAFDLLNCCGGETLAHSLLEVFRDEIRLCLREALKESESMPNIVVQNCAMPRKLKKEIFVTLCKACTKSEPITLITNAAGTEPERLQIVPRHLMFSTLKWRVVYQRVRDNSMGELKLDAIEQIEPVSSAADTKP